VEDIQGSLQVLYEWKENFPRSAAWMLFTLQPSAGAHGELTAMMMARKYFRKK